jgi:hypothetical protein
MTFAFALRNKEASTDRCDVRPVNASGAKVLDRVQSNISTSTFTLRQAFTGAEISTDAIRSAGFNGWTDYTSTPDASEQVEEDNDVL